MATTGDDEKQVVVAAIVSNVYSQFQRLREKNLEWLMFECTVIDFFTLMLLLPETNPQQEGRVVVTRVSTLLLCIYSDRSAQFGMLKAKVTFAPSHQA